MKKPLKLISTIIVLIAIITCTSCDKRSDYFLAKNEKPLATVSLANTFSYLTANVSGNNYSDSLKWGNNYKIKLTLYDDAGSVTLKFLGDGELYHDSVLFNEKVFQNGEVNLIWSPDTLGVESFSIVVVDNYGIEKVLNFQFTIFLNITPTISWDIENVGFLDPLEKKIVVTGEDGDRLYGGSIIYYQYVINSDTTLHPYPFMYYIFPSPGNYTISVKCMDSNFAWSNVITLNNYLIN
jgi:hypothetical protein